MNKQDYSVSYLHHDSITKSDTYSKDECEGEYLRGFMDCAKLNVGGDLISRSKLKKELTDAYFYNETLELSEIIQIIDNI